MEAVLEAFRPFERPHRAAKVQAFRDLFRQGVTPERLRAAARENPTSDFFAVIRSLQNGHAKVPARSGRPTKPVCPQCGGHGHVVDLSQTPVGAPTAFKPCPTCAAPQEVRP